MASEEFAFMLQVCLGAYFWLGAGKSEALHHCSDDFNDQLIEHAANF